MFTSVVSFHGCYHYFKHDIFRATVFFHSTIQCYVAIIILSGIDDINCIQQHNHGQNNSLLMYLNFCSWLISNLLQQQNCKNSRIKFTIPVSFVLKISIILHGIDDAFCVIATTLVNWVFYSNMRFKHIINCIWKCESNKSTNSYLQRKEHFIQFCLFLVFVNKSNWWL